MINKIVGRVRDDAGLDLFLDGKKLDPKPSQKIVNHSPDGFNAGYGGSGVAQSALAILLAVTDKETAMRLHQDFKWIWLADPKYLGVDFEIEVDIKTWIERFDKPKC